MKLVKCIVIMYINIVDKGKKKRKKAFIVKKNKIIFSGFFDYNIGALHLVSKLRFPKLGPRLIMFPILSISFI